MSKKWLALAIIGGGCILTIIGIGISLLVTETVKMIILFVASAIVAGIGIYTIKALKPKAQ